MKLTIHDWAFGIAVGGGIAIVVVALLIALGL